MADGGVYLCFTGWISLPKRVGLRVGHRAVRKDELGDSLVLGWPIFVVFPVRRILL